MLHCYVSAAYIIYIIKNCDPEEENSVKEPNPSTIAFIFFFAGFMDDAKTSYPFQEFGCCLLIQVMYYERLPFPV